jgi:hypothetical protein
MLADRLLQENGITRTDSEDQPSSKPPGLLVKEALVRRVSQTVSGKIEGQVLNPTSRGEEMP